MSPDERHHYRKKCSMSTVVNDSIDTETLRYLWTPDLDPLFWCEGRVGVASAWYGHIPFAHWVVGAAKPRTLVELGTHNGVSYSAFCEAVVRNRFDTRCYAVDTWKGDDQTGYYGEEVYLDLRRFHDNRYGAFSELLWCTFDDALVHMSDASVDLLHIDGLHTYEAVRHDFQSWRPKLSESAIVLLHDTNVRERDFGVWRLWEELRTQFPSFEFLHGHGLGVLAVGRSISPQVKVLCSLHDLGCVNAIRQRFSLLGERWTMSYQREQLRAVEVAARDSRILSLEAQLKTEVAARDSRILSLEAAVARHTAAEVETAQLRARAAERAKQAREEAVNAMVRTAASKTKTRKPGTSSIKAPDLFACQTMKQNGRIAVVLHLYYTDLWPEFEKAISSISEPFDLFVTLTSRDIEVEVRVQKAFPQAQLLHFENRGRDILPFVVLINSGVLFRYELVCKLHTKRSLHRVDGDHWRQVLVDGILGGQNLVHCIVEAFDGDPDLGIVVTDGQLYGLDQSHWDGNLKRLRSLGPKIGIADIPDCSLFPGGSMYWIRPFLLRQIGALRLSPEDFELEPLPADGTTAHGVERLLGLICHDAGMRIIESGKLSNTQMTAVIPIKQYPQLIAFYLPQFHPIPENDDWWGTGFTEWTNVTRAVPMFRHHRQPRLPADLGFYDLRLPEVRDAQAELARRYGLSAFCYYYYWFNGRRLLQRPLDEVLQSGSPDFPFMICWANEPWSRNWDGGNREVLVPQTYEPGWVKTFAQDIAPILSDKRYFRIDGKPVVLIYRVMHIPDRAAAFSQLRVALREQNIEEVYLVAGWFDIQGDQAAPADPRELGIDRYFEFPPHGLQITEITEATPETASDFAGRIYSYESAVESALAKLNDSPSPPPYRGVMTGWDNTARRMNHSHIVHGSTPVKFRRWLRRVVEHEAQVKDETGRMVFINAWNEWAEGTYLEPDRDYGHGWLEAVASALGINVRPNQDPSAMSAPDRR
jgi:lipopolysaccharide biosynthesis protein